MPYPEGMSKPTYSAEQIANFFLAISDADSHDISNLKLQKLCYYAQGVCSAMRDAPLISDVMEAWDHGPVFPNLYHAHKHNKSGAIPKVEGFDFEQIGAQDRAALTDVYNYYGQFSAWRLREMTHDEKPWIDAYKSPERHIHVDSMIGFFSPQVDETYKAKIYS